jgi:hypothetical protein
MSSILTHEKNFFSLVEQFHHLFTVISTYFASLQNEEVLHNKKKERKKRMSVSNNNNHETQK